MLRILAIVFALVAIALAARAAFIPAKAWLAGYWLDQAFDRATETGMPVAPWSWADFRVAGMLSGGGLDDIPVLDRASGQALAFGAGWHEDNQGHGPVVLSGHRDTHFAPLRDMTPGMILDFTQPDTNRRFRVVDALLVDTRQHDLHVPTGTGLVLITCWPFGAIDPDTPWRYVVMAETLQR